MIIDYLLRQIDYWWNPLVHCVGLCVTIWAFRRCRKKGYAVLAFYFALAVITLTVWKPIRLHLRRRAYERDTTPEMILRREEMNNEMDAVWEKYRDARPSGAARRNVNFPLGPMLLVIGLWLIARKEEITEPKVGPVSFEAEPSVPPDEPST